MGGVYINRQLEGIPDQVVDLKTLGTDCVISRMDILFDQNILHQQLQISNVIIITDKEIDLNLLATFRPKIKEFIYFIDEKSRPEYLESIKKLGFPSQIHTYLTGDVLNNIKLDYLDIGIIIQRKEHKQSDIEELKNKNVNNLYYRSGKFVLSKGKVYSSIASYKINQPLDGFGFHLEKVPNTTDFWKELDHFLILEKEEKKELTF